MTRDRHPQVSTYTFKGMDYIKEWEIERCVVVNDVNLIVVECRHGRQVRESWAVCSVTKKIRQMSIKVAQKGFHQKNDRF